MTHFRFFILVFAISCSTPHAQAAENAQWVHIEVDGHRLSAVYQTASSSNPRHQPAVMIIAGSGATDHNGNNESLGLLNNSYQMLGQALNQAGFAVLRPDKRGVGRSRKTDQDQDQSGTRFDDHVKDISAWSGDLRQTHPDITVIGHSLGGLMAMHAAQQKPVDRLVALASVAKSAYVTVQRQMQNQPEFVKQAALPLLDRLAQGETIPATEVPGFLMPLFGPKVQGYLQSFMQLSPRDALAQLSLPTLVLIGDHDVQISVHDTTQMAANLPHVELMVLTEMNHVLKSAPAERIANLATYAEPDRPLHPDLMPALLAFLPTIQPTNPK